MSVQGYKFYIVNVIFIPEDGLVKVSPLRSKSNIFLNVAVGQRKALRI